MAVVVAVDPQDRSDHRIKMHLEYFQTLEGIVRTVALVINFLTMIVCAVAGGSTGSWAASCAGFDVLYLLLTTLIRCFGYEFLFHGLLGLVIAIINTIVWLVTFIVLAADVGVDDDSEGDAAAAFAFFCIIAWAAIIFINFRYFRERNSPKEESEKNDPV
ncbi:uncharacterized protein LOC134179063 [Corticium candelabrum]|uniref:uncharacterized protein LOC134179063 n=1 Tax=Corticium candelabrum TaxID=121492 RepID=UPI002E273A70|nr:uncharacterized protein LOC134179063 [Corticium candelabrum]